MQLKIGVIVSSTRPTRLGRKVTDWFMSQIKEMPDVQFEVLDLAEINLPVLSEPQSAMTGEYTQESSKQWSKRIASFDGFVWVTAEYNHGYPAPLKNAIDTLYHEWSKKPVAFVGYGGMGGVRSIEQLVQVAAELKAVPLSATSSTVRILDVWNAVDENGNVKPEFIRGSVDGLVENLTWWARALKPAREQA